MTLTEHQKKVYEGVKRIPRGFVSSYEEIAKLIGISGGSRAVGVALRKNPYAPTEVPCHRVIRKNRHIGGYKGASEGDCIREKKKRLKAEGVLFDEKNRLKDARRFYRLV